MKLIKIIWTSTLKVLKFCGHLISQLEKQNYILQVFLQFGACKTFHGYLILQFQ